MCTRIPCYFSLMVLLGLASSVFAQSFSGDESVRLIIRGDDLGSFHAANVACIESFEDGIMRTVEIMVPCPWYPEAVEMLKKVPELDVGIHLVLTSEWENMKWRPVTGRSSITDRDGYFYPMVWPNKQLGPGNSLLESDWSLAEIEEELRAQIVIAKRDIPTVSHITSHMGFTGAHPAIDSLVRSLAREYDLDIDPSAFGVNRFRFERNTGDQIGEWESEFISQLSKLEPGNYLFVEHPAMDVEEMATVGHAGYRDVAEERQMVLDLFTSKKVMMAIAEYGIELISYADLPELSKRQR